MKVNKQQVRVKKLIRSSEGKQVAVSISAAGESKCVKKVKVSKQQVRVVLQHTACHEQCMPCSPSNNQRMVVE